VGVGRGRRPPGSWAWAGTRSCGCSESPVRGDTSSTLTERCCSCHRACLGDQIPSLRYRRPWHRLPPSNRQERRRSSFVYPAGSSRCGCGRPATASPPRPARSAPSSVPMRTRACCPGIGLERISGLVAAVCLLGALVTLLLPEPKRRSLEDLTEQELDTPEMPTAPLGSDRTRARARPHPRPNSAVDSCRSASIGSPGGDPHEVLAASRTSHISGQRLRSALDKSRPEAPPG
jgi:hypothetical protein